jgi:uncharacterized protein
MVRLGKAYWGKQGIAADFEKGRTWLDKAAQAGSLEAQMFLGAAYLSGNGLPKDRELAAKYLLQVALQPKVDKDFQGSQALAQYWMAFLYEQGHGVEKSHQNAIKFLQMSAENGNPGAQFDLASLFNDGSGGMIVDKAQACRLFEEAANQGHVRAMHNVAFCYQTGTGVAKDLNKAASYYTKAAEGGSVRSEFNLAMTYGELGDAADAYFWLRLAQTSGYAVNQDLVDKAIARLTPSQRLEQETKIPVWTSAHMAKKTDGKED